MSPMGGLPRPVRNAKAAPGLLRRLPGLPGKDPVPRPAGCPCSTPGRGCP